MTRRHLTGAALLLLLLPLPAQAAPAATLDAGAMEVDGTLQGPLAGLLWNPRDGPLDGLDRLALTAASATVNLTSLQKSYTVGVTTPYNRSASPPSGDPRTSADARTNLTLAGASGEPFAFILALPLDGAATVLVHDRVLLAPANSSQVTMENRVGGANHAIPTATALQATLPGPLLRITGSVRLVVAGVDLALGSDQGDDTLHTRTDVDSILALPGLYVHNRTDHQAVLDLRGADLLLPATEAYLGAATVSADGVWTFRAATGTVQASGAPRPLSGSVVRIDGAFDAAVARLPGDRLAADLDGRVEALTVDGVGVAGVAADPARGGSAGPWAAAVGLAVLLAVAAAAHGSLGQRRFRRMDDAMDRADYARALALASRFRLHPRLAQDAVLAAAICLLATGRPAEALERMEARTRWSPSRRATRDFLLARAAAALGRPEEAERRLAQSLAADPALLADAQVDPLLAVVLRTVRTAPAGEAYA